MSKPSFPQPSNLAHHWGLDPAVVHLNHGSFGACPTAVLDAQRRHIERVEADAVRFFVDEAWSLLDKPRAALAPILGCAPADLVFVPNATHGVTAVIHNLRLEPGDEIIACTHEYPACQNILRDLAARTGVVIVEPELPWPIASEQQVASAVLGCVTSRTRVCLLSAVTSPTAIVMPVAMIAAGMHERGVEVLLDAAHAAGFTPTDLRALGVAWATGNAHKWLCAPKGAAWLFVRDDLQPGFRPPILSVYAEGADDFGASQGRSAFGVEFDYVGTRDVTPALTITDAVEFLQQHAGSIDAYAAANRELVITGRRIICDRLGVEPSVPESMLGAMAAIDLPPPPPAGAPSESIWLDPLKQRLLDRWHIQVPVWSLRPGVGTGRMVRISANLYNSEAQYHYLADALAAELEDERRG